MKFVRTGLLLAAALGFVQSATAADMPRKAAPPVVAPVASWTGWYVGGHVGYGWEDPTYRFSDPNNVAFANCGPCFGTAGFGPNAATDSTSGFIGGAHFGYNWQLNSNWLVGLEGEFTWTGMNSSLNTPLIGYTLGTLAPFAIPGSGLSLNTDINWIASLRGRLGYITGPWLLYATGGAAWLDYDFTGTASCTTGAAPGGCPTGFTTAATASFGDTKTGWTIGGGLEWQMPASNWRMRGEYAYYQFDFTDAGTGIFRNTVTGANSACLVAAPACPGNFSVSDISMHTVRLGLTYAFR